MKKYIKPSEYVSLYRQIGREFKPVDISTCEYEYRGQKTLIQRLPYVSSGTIPVIRYRIIFPQGYPNKTADYVGLEPDLPYWMHVKNEIVNTLRTLSK